MNTKSPFLKENGALADMPNLYFLRVQNLLLVFLFLGMNTGVAKSIHLRNPLHKIVAERPVIRIEVGNCTPAVRDSLSQLCFGSLSIKASATDDDTPEDDLNFEYKIDLYNDGVGAYNGYDCWVGKVSKNQLKAGMDPSNDFNIYTTNRNYPFDASGRYPVGIHKICWFVEDTSGLSTTLCELFEIKDCQAPTPYIISGLFNVQMKTNGCIGVFAKDLNLGSQDNCTTDKNLRYYFNGDQMLTELIVCCDDFVAAGANNELIVEVQLWVEDEEGNSDHAKTEILVTDPLGICGGHFGGKIMGEVYSIFERKDTISSKNVIVELLTNNTLKKFQLVNDGNYQFGDLPSANYTLRASKDDDPNAFVSICDMVAINKHSLGIKSFDNSFQTILADVNNSQTITAADVREIRNLILREIDKFPKMPAWLVFPVIDSIPRIPNLSIELDLKSFEKKIVDFRAYKLGDVNDLVSSDTAIIIIPEPKDSLVFVIQNKQIRKGEKMKVDFYSNNFNYIEGYQFTMKFNRAALKFDSILNNSGITLTDPIFGLRYADMGYITTCWMDLASGPRSAMPDDILFTIAFEALEDGALCDFIRINGDLTPEQVCKDSALVLHNIVLDACDVIINTQEKTSDLVTIFPNPIRNEIHFQFSESLRFPLEIEFISSNGKIIAHKNIRQFTSHWICETESLAPGVYILNIRDDRRQFVRKVMLAH
ncbi:MAG: T9SS type A sorting domain-containing protein [Saprospiraceae bacterium]|nr:T9SS type A sorting domain-containing protein [Saprospiraceae bacterium]